MKIKCLDVIKTWPITTDILEPFYVNGPESKALLPPNSIRNSY